VQLPRYLPPPLNRNFDYNHVGTDQKLHVMTSVLGEDGGIVDHTKLRPVARLGSSTYSRLLDVLELPPVEWPDAQEECDALRRGQTL
jgi:hypothetical protein